MAATPPRPVLVVEDEFYLASDVSQTLKRGGHAVMGPFPDQAEAVAAIEHRKPHFAILDVNLGEGATFDLADRLRALGVPFMFFTGYDPEAIPARFADVVRLEKPVIERRLVEAIARVSALADAKS